MRKMGDVLLDLETILDELYIEHDLQLGDVLGMIVTNTQVHYPDNIEVYQDNTHPVFYYGFKEGEKNEKKKRD